MTKVVVACVVTVVLAAVPAAAHTEPFGAAGGTTYGVVLVDRATGATTVEYNPHLQVRSASLVKLLIALDYYARHGSGDVPPGDRELLDSMLRSSDDEAASVLWTRQGSGTVVQRMAAQLGLQDTEPPADPAIWGYTATSAADVARTYDYILDEAQPAARAAILGSLGRATRCAVDGRDQYFGIPRAVPQPSAVKQGWSGFGEVGPGDECTPTPPGAADPDAAAPAAPGPDAAGDPPEIDLDSEAMHTSGAIGVDQETIMVVLSLHPAGTSYEAASRRVTAVTRGLYPGG